MRNISTAARNSVLQTRNLLLEKGSRETLGLHRLPVCEKKATSVSPFAVLFMKARFSVEFYGPWEPWPIEIDGLPINSMVIFHGELLNTLW